MAEKISQISSAKAKIKSIRRFLIVSMLSLITAVIAILALLNYVQLANQNEQIYQIQLINAAQLLNAFSNVEPLARIKQTNFDSLNREVFNTLLRDNQLHNDPDYLNFKDSLAFQIWDTNKQQLILRSPQAPKWALSDISLGFSDMVMKNNEHWHSFTLTNPKAHRRIIIGMRDSLKHQLNYDIFLHDLAVLIVMYLIIAIVIVVIIEVGLIPLKRLTGEVAERDANNLRKIDLQTAPIEVAPLVEEINKLLNRIHESLEREKRFTADAAHELRTPIAALKTQAEVASKVKDQAERQRILKNIITSTNRFAHVIEQLLTLSRLEPQDKLPSCELINLNALSEQVMADLALLAIEESVEIELYMPEQPLWINGNQALIGVLLRNLIDNGIRYTPAGGKVMVLGSDMMDGIALQVIDSGPGISDENKQRIFDRFYRQLGNKAKGSGLGLSIVKRIVDLHKATIEVRKPDQQIGLEMRVIFPHNN